MSLLDNVDLPLDFPRPAFLSQRGAGFTTRLEETTTAALRQLCREQEVPLHLGLLAGLAATLGRLCGQEQLSLGFSVATSASGPEDVLLVPFRLVEDQGLRALLTATADNVRAGKSLGSGPLPHPVGLRWREPEGVTAGEPHAAPVARLELEIFAAEKAGGIELEVVYATDLFQESSLRRWMDALAALLAAGARDPERRLHRLPLLPAAERQKIVAGHGSRPLSFPQDLLLHETFFQQAAKTPDRVALRSGKDRRTYAEAAALASQVAWALCRHGVGPEVRVGVFLERTHRLVATLIGVLAADGAYVPLDPEYPAERIGFTLDDAEARVIVTQRSLAEKLPPTSATVVYIEDLETATDLPASPPPRLGCPQNLAYLIYTSGSTGRPKGVAITHRSVVAFLEWTQHVFSEQEMACVLFSTSICFDISIFEMFATLQRGGTVVVVKNAFDLPHLECRDELTLIDTVPSVARELLREGPLPPQVETVNLAGEALPQDLVDLCWQEPGVKKVYNFYGPTEDTTFSTYEMCPPGLPPTIGHLIEGSRGFVVDRHLELLPLGVPGVLYLAGEGLSRGYLGRPRLTAERYVPDPYSGNPGARMYCVGDLVKHREDGGFLFCGRIDHQVKIRGYRVELGEIEIALRSHEAVAQAVVVARSDGPGGQRLVSYVVRRPGSTVDGDTLKAFLAERLPSFMVPQATVFLDVFPMTPNGKVDRKVLPAPESLGADRKPFRAPRTEAEKALAAIWENLLGQENIGLDDDFLELGGDSILVIQAVSRALAAGWDIEPQEIFAHPTLAEAAASARKAEIQETTEESRLDQDELDDVLADLEGIL